MAYEIKIEGKQDWKQVEWKTLAGYLSSQGAIRVLAELKQKACAEARIRTLFRDARGAHFAPARLLIRLSADMLPHGGFQHRRDSDCVLDETETCIVCSVSHGDPCPDCEARGFHLDTCQEMRGCPGCGRQDYRHNPGCEVAASFDPTPTQQEFPTGEDYEEPASFYRDEEER